MPYKKGRQPITVIVVPHSEQPPISFRLPPWLFPALIVLFLGVVASSGVFYFRAYRLGQELEALKSETHLAIAREREMRDTILSQQHEVRSLSEQVTAFENEWAGVDALSHEIQELVGYPTPTATPLATPTNVPALPSSLQSRNRAAALDIDGVGGQMPGPDGSRNMILAVESSQELVEMHSIIPRTLHLLVNLRDEVAARLSRIDDDHKEDPGELEKQLRILAAAPSRWPTEKHSLSSKFGYRTLNGRLGFHKGIDIPVWYGTKVFATQDGAVTRAGWQPTYGWTVEIKHDMGFTTMYAHNSKLAVSAGDEVKAGDLICYSGNSGYTTGPHLHYEIHLNGTAVDPLKYIDSGSLAAADVD